MFGEAAHESLDHMRAVLLVTLSRLHFPDHYNLSDERFCAAAGAINVKS